MENGSSFVDALKIKVQNLKHLKEICKAIQEAGKPYKFITIDTITAVEEMAKPLAIQLYQNSPMFSDKYADIKEPASLPNGCGWVFWRQGIEMIVDMVAKCTDNIILCGHVKDTSLNDGLDRSIRDLDLAGKVKRILSARSDAIGFVHRDEYSNLCINFGQDGEVLTGARPAHLANKDIVVAERQEDGSFISRWDRIFPSLAK